MCEKFSVCLRLSVCVLSWSVVLCNDMSCQHNVMAVWTKYWTKSSYFYQMHIIKHTFINCCLHLDVNPGLLVMPYPLCCGALQIFF